MVKYITERPMLLSGILCTIIAFFGYNYMPIVLALVILLCVIIGLMLIYNGKTAVVFALLLVTLMASRTVYTYWRIEDFRKYIGNTYSLKCVVCEVKANNVFFNKLVVEVSEAKEIPKGTKIEVITSPFKPRLGQCIRANAKFTEIKEKNIKRMYSKEIYLTAKLSNMVFENDEDFVLSGVGKLRKYIQKTLFRNLNYQKAATLSALIYGDKTAFSDEFDYMVKRAGVSHIMVVSGMHLGIFVKSILSVAEWLGYNKYLKALCMIASVFFLSFLCGFTASILRAGITYILMAVSVVLNRKCDASNAIGAALTFILIASPVAIFDIAPQLSMLSTFGILVISLPTMKYLTEKGFLKSKILKFLVSNTICTISATLLTLPVLISCFGYISVISLIPNLLIAPVIDWVLKLAFLMLVVNLFSPFLTALLFKGLDILLGYINYIINFFGNIEWAIVELPNFFAFLSIILILLIFSVLIACKKYGYVVKLNEMKEKYIKEGGKKLKWQ